MWAFWALILFLALFSLKEAEYFMQTIASSLPPHDYTEIVSVLAASMLPTTRIVQSQSSFQPKSFLSLLSRHKVNIVTMSAANIYQCTQQKDQSIQIYETQQTQLDLGNVKVVSFWDAKMHPKILDKFATLFPNGIATPLHMAPNLGGQVTLPIRTGDSQGYLFHNLQAMVIDDDEQPLGPHEIGRLMFAIDPPRGVSMLGPAVGHSTEIVESNWIDSGGVGYLTEDGEVFIVERRREKFIANGEEIYTSDLEAYLAKLPYVQSACVIDAPSEDQNAVIVAAVVKEADSLITEDEIANHLSLYFNHPFKGFVTFVNTLETTGRAGNKRLYFRELVTNLLQIN